MTHYDPKDTRGAIASKCRGELKARRIKTTQTTKRPTFVVDIASPSTTRYISESRYRGTSSARRALVAGASSEGLMMHALPAAIAPAYIPAQEI